MASVLVMVSYRSGVSVLSADRPIAPISPIHKLAGRWRAQVAGLVRRCVEEVERRGAMEQVGIYRLCGSSKRAARLRDQLELHGPLAVNLSLIHRTHGPARTSRTDGGQPLTHHRLTDQLKLHGPLAVDLSPTSVGDVNVITGQPP